MWFSRFLAKLRNLFTSQVPPTHSFFHNNAVTWNSNSEKGSCLLFSSLRQRSFFPMVSSHISSYTRYPVTDVYRVRIELSTHDTHITHKLRTLQHQTYKIDCSPRPGDLLEACSCKLTFGNQVSQRTPYISTTVSAMLAMTP